MLDEYSECDIEQTQFLILTSVFLNLLPECGI